MSEEFLVRIDGEVETPQQLSFEDLAAMDEAHQVADVTRETNKRLGDAVLLNSAVARARNPVGMAGAMRHAASAGRLAFASGRIPRKTLAERSSPVEGRARPAG